MGRKTLFLRRHGALCFLSRREILDQLSADLIAGMSHEMSSAPPILIYMGVHKRFGLQWLRRGQKLAVQTEQFYDRDGKPLWALKKRGFSRAVLRAAKRCDLLLDLSASNRKFYEDHAPDLLGKLVFGPHIFPKSAPEFVPGTKAQAVFFGAMNPRRAALVEELGTRASVFEGKIFHTELREALAPYAAVLNLHFDDGIYTEAPRLLSAMRAGKPVMSEELAPPFVAGEHYVPLGANLEQTDLCEIYDRMCQFLADRFCFEELVSALVKRH